MSGSTRLLRVVLENEPPPDLPSCIEADREQAVSELTSANHFVPLPHLGQTAAGPYALHLSIREARLVFDIRTGDGAPVTVIGLALGPSRPYIKDYHLLVDSYTKAVQEGRKARIQAIDMGRRGLHNEGAAFMMQRLKGKIAIDFETARRLFTLVCVLHQRVSAR
ncbi:MAG: UPF0262 family protein [Acetobacteraceae bacterium]|nr:UPF0262 family protein [Acetobacteraceae bacterium]